MRLRFNRDQLIMFKEEKARRLYLEHDDVLVVLHKVTNILVKGILIDTGNSVDNLYYNTFQKIDLIAKDLYLITFSHDSSNIISSHYEQQAFM